MCYIKPDETVKVEKELRDKGRIFFQRVAVRSVTPPCPDPFRGLTLYLPTQRPSRTQRVQALPVLGQTAMAALVIFTHYCSKPRSKYARAPGKTAMAWPLHKGQVSSLSSSLLIAFPRTLPKCLVHGDHQNQGRDRPRENRVP